LSAETIVSNYLVEEKATNLINAFVFGLTSLISDLKLSFLASGGIYLAGSLMRSLYNKGALTNLEEIFNKHKSKMHSKILRDASISLITKEHTPLYGNLNYSNIRRNHE
jgi:glucokinase